LLIHRLLQDIDIGKLQILQATASQQKGTGYMALLAAEQKVILTDP